MTLSRTATACLLYLAGVAVGAAAPADSNLHQPLQQPDVAQRRADVFRPAVSPQTSRSVLPPAASHPTRVNILPPAASLQARLNALRAMAGQQTRLSPLRTAATQQTQLPLRTAAIQQTHLSVPRLTASQQSGPKPLPLSDISRIDGAAIHSAGAPHATASVGGAAGAGALGRGRAAAVVNGSTFRWRPPR